MINENIGCNADTINLRESGKPTTLSEKRLDALDIQQETALKTSTNNGDVNQSITPTINSRNSNVPASATTYNLNSSSSTQQQSNHLPLSATVSLTNSGISNRATPILRTDRQYKKSGMDPKVSPSKRNVSKVNRKEKRHQVSSILNRPCHHHSFLTEVTDVQQMEQGLVQLLDDFHSGKLQAFGKDCSFQKMDHIREQQEKLARLHFELGSQQENYGTHSEEGRAVAKDHLAKLMAQLQELSSTIEQLQSSTSGVGLQTEV